MMDSFLIGCNSKNEDLRLNSLEVLTVLVSQTEVWLQVQDNVFKLYDCLVNVAYDCRANPEFHEPLVLAVKNMVTANEKLSKMTINTYNNPRKAQLLNIVKKIDAELISMIEDKPENSIPNIDNQNQNHRQSDNKKSEKHEPQAYGIDANERDISGSNSGDFVNIWEEKDFTNQSDAQKSKSLTYVVNYILTNDLKNVNKLKEFLS